MTRVFRRLAVLTACFPLSMAAQSDSIARQRDVAIEMLRFAWGNRPVVLWTEFPPPGFPRYLIPSDARRLGGTAQYGMFVWPGIPDSALARYRTYIEREGWRPPAPGPQIRERGFVSGIQENVPSGVYCRDRYLLYLLAYRSGASDSSVIQVRHVPPFQGSSCEPREVRADQNLGAMPPFDVPVLYPPSGKTTGGFMRSGSGADSNHLSAYAELRSSLGVPEVVAAYAEQLRTDGWTVSPTVAQADGATLFARKTDDQRRPLVAILSDAFEQPNIHYLLFRIDVVRRTP
jgi:hypothetical protein